MRLAVAYVGMLVVMVACEAVMLPLVVLPMFEAAVPQLLAETPDYLAAAVFYAIYPLGLLRFAVAPSLGHGSLVSAIRDGAFLGFIAYATFELTNTAVIEGWLWSLVVPDVAWGTVLGGIVAAAGYLIGGLVKRPA